MYKTKYALRHHSRTYTNIYIGIGSICMYKGHLNDTGFIIARIAQSVEHQTANLSCVGLSPTVGKNCFFFSFCILSPSTRFWQVDWSNTNEIRHDVYPRHIDV